MIGASKINHETDDLQRLNEMFDMGLNNSHISRIYRTNSGEALSRIHISQIRRGERWNTNTRSFLMKSELNTQDSIQTRFNGQVYKTTISQVVTDTHVYHIYLTFKDTKPMLLGNVKLMENKPSINDLMKFHFQTIDNQKEN